LLAAPVEGLQQWTIQSIEQLGTIFLPDALPDVTLPCYPGLGPALHPVVGFWVLAGNRIWAFSIS
ncbi:Glucokinase, partial [Clarias magur]